MAALNLAQPDRVPVFELYINESALVNLARLLGMETQTAAERDEFGQERTVILDLYCRIVEDLGLDVVCMSHSVGMESIDEDHVKDRFGTVYALSEHGEPLPIGAAINGPADVAGFDMAAMLRREDFATAEYVYDRTDKARCLAVLDPFKISWRLRGGMENLLMDYALHPRLVHDLQRIGTEYDMAVIDIAEEMAVDMIIFPGDLAGEDTTIMSPAHYREYIKPYHRQLTEYAHAKGIKVIKHTDGNAWPILDDFLDVGFDAFHPVQPQCMDIGEVKRHLAGKACVMGNIDCRNLLVLGTEQEVADTVEKTIELAAPGGGYIISSSNSIHPGCRPENYIAMVRAAHEHGVY
jgi:uroporphyrinogen decarboxylase